MLIEKIGHPAMLEQAAEECVELAKACLKYARLIRGENPTFRAPNELSENIAEEAADVIICLEELNLLDDDGVKSWIEVKKERMEERFKE